MLSSTFFTLYFHQQIHPFQLFSVVGERFFQIDPRGLDAAMSQHPRQLYDIMMQPVIRPGKQVPQIMWKNLFLINARLPAQALHLPPYV